MSMFRPASEISSSDSQSSSDEIDDNLSKTSNSKAREVSSTESNTHLDSLDSGLETESLSDTSRDVRNVENEGHAVWMTTALLEFYCMSKAADILNAKEGSMRYTRDSPEVQYLGKKLYSYESQVLSSHGMLPGGIHREEWGEKRQNYRDTLDVLGLPALEGLNLDDIPGKMQSLGAAGDIVLASKSSKHVQIHAEKSFAGPSQLKRQNSGLLGFKEPIHIEHNFPALGNGRLDMGALPNQPFSLLGSSPVSFPLFRPNPPPPTHNMSRYAMEFSEVKILGRGSFGEVFHVKNHIDGQSYAIKKIPLSHRRLQQLQRGNQNQLESIMKEIRTLARLEHMNVVRYYGAWVEQADTSAIFHPRSQQSAMEIHHEETQSLHISHEATDDQSFGIVFEHSESSAVEAYSESTSASVEYEVGVAGHSHRRYSHATTASYRSKNSLARSLEDDDEVESIPRDFNLASHGQLSTLSSTDDDIFTDGLSYDPSKLQVQRRRQNGTQIPAVILHIQMSLHPISLSSYLSPQAMAYMEDEQFLHRRHCFHLIPSLRLMLRIISGVEYLHAQGIIHRDLKPANIFLSSSEHVNTDGCPSCHSSHGSAPRYCHPRIGDFGLVADMSHLNDCTSPTLENGPKVHRVVGTEFYRPPLSTNTPEHCGDTMSSENQQATYIVNETLDVYALGVILFELLYRLNTKMERQMVLTDLTRGSNRQSSIRSMGHTVFPTDFANKVDMGSTILNDNMSVAEALMRCISGMLEPNPQRRWRCVDIKQHLESIIGAAIAQGFSCH